MNGFFNGYVVMSKKLRIFPFPSFIFSQLPLSIQNEIFNIHDKKYENKNLGGEKQA